MVERIAAIVVGGGVWGVVVEWKTQDGLELKGRRGRVEGKI